MIRHLFQKSFAERCYEERLFFYFSFTLQICVDDRSGEAKTCDILALPNNEEETTLAKVWDPLFDHCSNTLRSKRLLIQFRIVRKMVARFSLDAASIRLSKLSDLWKKVEASYWKFFGLLLTFQRTTHRLLLSLVREMADLLVRLKEEDAENCAAAISRIIRLPNDVHFVQKGRLKCYSHRRAHSSYSQVTSFEMMRMNLIRPSKERQSQLLKRSTLP